MFFFFLSFFLDHKNNDINNGQQERYLRRILEPRKLAATDVMYDNQLCYYLVQFK